MINCPTVASRRKAPENSEIAIYVITCGLQARLLTVGSSFIPNDCDKKNGFPWEKVHKDFEEFRDKLREMPEKSRLA